MTPAKTRLDLVSQEYKRDPFPSYARLHRESPVVKADMPLIGTVWVIVPHADVTTLLKDKARFVQEPQNAGRRHRVGTGWWTPRFLKALTDNMLGRDEPAHRRLRGLVDKAFSRRGVEELRPVLLETGMLPMTEPETIVVLDTAAGLVTATAACRDGKCERVTLDFVPSFVEHFDHPLELQGEGTLKVDVAFGGCYFAFVDAAALGFAIKPEEARDLVAMGTKIREAAREQIHVRHPLVEGFDQVEYALFCAREGRDIRNGNIIFPGRMDRSPCGTGTAARLAALHARGELTAGEEISSRSIIDSEFRAQVTGVTMVGRRKAVTTRLSGRAWIYGLYTLGVDPSDPYQTGYMLADTWGEGVSGLSASTKTP